MKYAVVIEKAEGNYSAYSPDVPGCGTVGDTLEEARQNLLEAIEFHLEGLLEAGLPIPEQTSQVGYIEIQIP